MGLYYKYYGFNSGIKALSENKLGFTRPDHFNDTMECKLWSLRHGIDDRLLRQFMEKIAVLSLTTCPRNPLMWSHYADSHKGFVIGYDSDDPIFSDGCDVIIPAKRGAVRYNQEFKVASPKETAREAMLSVMFNENYTGDKIRALYNILLMKQNCWKYEKEIRVVVLIDSVCHETHGYNQLTDRNWSHIRRPISPNIDLSEQPYLYLTSCRPKIIRHVILGMKNPLIADRKAGASAGERLRMRSQEEGWTVEVAQWNQQGEITLSAPPVDFDWSLNEKIVSKDLLRREVEVIFDKVKVRDNIKDDVIVTSFFDGRVEAYFRSEIT